MKTFGDRLKWYILTHFGSVQNFSDIIGITRQTANNWVNDTFVPRDKQLDKIINSTGASRDWLLYGEGSPYDCNMQIGNDFYNEYKAKFNGLNMVQEEKPLYQAEAMQEEKLVDEIQAILNSPIQMSNKLLFIDLLLKKRKTDI